MAYREGPLAVASRLGRTRATSLEVGPWSGSRSPDQGPFASEPHSYFREQDRTGRISAAQFQKGQARNKCALLTRSKPSNRRKLRILLHSFPAWPTPPKQVTPALGLVQDTGRGAFCELFPHGRISSSLKPLGSSDVKEVKGETRCSRDSVLLSFLWPRVE